MRSTRTITSILIGAVTVLFFAAAIPAAGAQETTGSIAQGFSANSENGDIEPGALVSVKSGDQHAVELATTRNANQMVGVADSNPLVVLSGGNKEVNVVLSGTTSVLVSDINGPIKASSKITISPIAGVGMLATVDSQVVGTAQADFNTKNSRTQKITDDQGGSHTVHIGYIPLQVGVAYYRSPGSDFLPPFVQHLANNIAGRPVSLIRIIICSLLLIITFIAIAVLIYSSVRTAITSLGRNPLAAGAIRKSLYQVALVIIVISAGSLLASYIILAA